MSIRSLIPALSLLFGLLMLPIPAGAQDRIRVDGPTDLQQFGLLAADEGWILLNQHLYRTESGGQVWLDITPSELAPSTILAVDFLDPMHGWLVLAGPHGSGLVAYRLARTQDGGATWQITALPLYEAGDPNAIASAAYLSLLDPQSAWLSIRRASGSNFRLGTLFHTTDGGDTWTQRTLPVGEPVYFVSETTGWTAGGATGSELYRTADGGRSWQPQAAAPSAEDGDTHRLYMLPVFRSKVDGLLPALAIRDDRASLELYGSADGGNSWSLTASVPAPGVLAPGAAVPFSVSDSGHVVALLPASRRLVTISPRFQATFEAAPDPYVAGIVDLQMATPLAGWARSVAGKRTAPDQTQLGPMPARDELARFALDTRLLQTRDGGRTWTKVPLPAAEVPEPDAAGSGPLSPGAGPGETASRLSGAMRPAGGGTHTFEGQGFDKCEIATLSQLQTWFNNSPYRAVNLYIGGSCRACANSALSASYLAELGQQGWSFIPTWVGPQSAGFGAGCARRISDDPLVAYQQGVDEARAAVQRATALGLTRPDGSGTVIYYDLESYTNTGTNRNAAKAFITGWTAQLQATGNLAGVYGAGCASYLTDLATISPAPDALWAAHWIYSAYTGEASVWNVACLPNSLWTNAQRVRQYTGGHSETWGGVALNIDCNVIDGVVADVLDTTPPVTSVSLSGLLGEDGWYRSNVQVTLTAADNTGGTGVLVTQYRVNASPWRTYSTAFSILRPGVHTVEYRSQDAAGNWEADQGVEIRIHASSPGNPTVYLPLIVHSVQP